MAEITFYVKLSPEIRAKWYSLTGDRSEYWTARIDERHLKIAQREHLLRMVNSASSPQPLPFYTLPYTPCDYVYATNYKPNIDFAHFVRSPHTLKETDEMDAELVSLIFNNAEPVEVVRAIIDSDYKRWSAAQREAFRLLNEAIDAWFVRTKERIAELRERGASAMTDRDVEWNIRPQRPGWLETVIKHDQRGNLVADVWRELNEAHEAALAEARLLLEKRRSAEEKRQRVERARNESEARTWVEEFGSDRLRGLVQEGYPFWREYIKERTKVEYPSFYPDIDNLVEYRELNWGDASPTNAQIEFAKRYGGRAVLMTRDVDGVYRNKTPIVLVENAFHGIDLVAYNW